MHSRPRVANLRETPETIKPVKRVRTPENTVLVRHWMLFCQILLEFGPINVKINSRRSNHNTPTYFTQRRTIDGKRRSPDGLIWNLPTPCNRHGRRSRDPIWQWRVATAKQRSDNRILRNTGSQRRYRDLGRCRKLLRRRNHCASHQPNRRKELFAARQQLRTFRQLVPNRTGR